MSIITADFIPFPKIGRLNRGMIITEKLDGTNAQVWVAPAGEEAPPHFAVRVTAAAGDFFVGAASRTRWIAPEADNFGFAAWVRKNATELAELGPGRHFGEWWGLGIQRGYGLHERRFSLFNAGRWGDKRPACCHVVPTIYEGPFEQNAVRGIIAGLRLLGSTAAPGFMKPEGVVIWHEGARQVFKVTLEGDDAPKSLAA
ncbi:MAG: RNA ligase family protein [Xanthobacteraceae bacterium]